jgi:DNA-directed RNA polymerase subunit RPC12/RpoP
MALRAAYIKSKSVVCEHCGARAQFVRSLPDIFRGSGTLKTYVCIACHKQTELASN